MDMDMDSRCMRRPCEILLVSGVVLDHADGMRLCIHAQAEGTIHTEEAETLDVEDLLAGDVAKVAASVAADARGGKALDALGHSGIERGKQRRRERRL